jgi:hypothetical protein
MPIDVTSQGIIILIIKELQAFTDRCFATQRIAKNTTSRPLTLYVFRKVTIDCIFKFLIAFYTFVISRGFEI